MTKSVRLFSLSKIAIILLALTLVSVFSVSAATLTGHISDQSGGEALKGATISLRSTDLGVIVGSTASDENGDYKINDIEQGNYLVLVSFVGYRTQMVAYSPVTDDKTASVDVALAASAMNLSGISISASRRPEKVVDAPAAVNVISSESIANRPTLTPTEHLKGMPGVDVSTTGLNQSNVVVRGFNNIFSGALLVLTDNRIARVPSLRFNAYNFIPTTNEDIERIEMVSGPGSALYGPNASSGVMHIVTKSPFQSGGTTVSVGGGERELRMTSFRHAGRINNRIAYKISGQFYEGLDWKATDSKEPDSIQLFFPTNSGREPIGDSIPNIRDFQTKKMGGEARFDFLLGDHTNLIVNSGINQTSSIELTGLGAGQAIDWRYWFFQTRVRYKNLFVQGFMNASDAGDTYLLRTGQRIVDKSKLWVGQVQHTYEANDRWSLTYGFDAIFTRPNTGGTINGRHEDDDDINELGVYLQTNYQLSDQFKLVGAARVDDNSRLEDKVVSPRAALVYQPNPKHTLRATYNRAFSTPDNNNLFLDIIEQVNPFYTGIDVRVQGVPESGFHWTGDPLAGDMVFYAPASGDPNATFNLDFTGFSDAAWTVGRGLTLSTLGTTLNGAVAAGLLSQAEADGLIQLVDGIAPASVGPMPSEMRRFDPDIGRFVDIGLNDVADIARLEPTITQTFELGYKGMIGERLQLSVDLYRTKKNNFVGPLTLESPSATLDSAAVYAFLEPYFDAAISSLPQAQQDALAQAGLILCPTCTVAEVLADAFAAGANNIPWGTWSPDEAFDRGATLVTYRNFGDISFYGADIGFAYHLTQNWNIGGSYSYVSKNFFGKSATQVHDINLNAPKHKIGAFVQFTEPTMGWDIQTRLRFVDAFDMDSPFIGTTVEKFTVIDLNVGVNFFEGTRFALSVQNLLDNKHFEFVGAPKIGRLMIARVTQSF